VKVGERRPLMTERHTAALKSEVALVAFTVRMEPDAF
jgi:hypothetical protein